MTDRHNKLELKTLFNPVTLITGGILLVGLILASLAVIFLARTPAPAAEVTPVITIIAAPSITPKSVQPSSIPSSTPTSLFFLPEGVIGVGAYVQVGGTEGAGLRMRAQPGLDGEVKFTAMDAEVFLVIDGPVDEDGYQWWHLEAPYDKSRNGWSAGEFLTPLQEE